MVIFRFSLGVFVLAFIRRTGASPNRYLAAKIVSFSGACQRTTLAISAHLQHPQVRFRN
jgi:hypothetical protein